MEKVCEQNCADYSGMSVLHAEACTCSCHSLKDETGRVGQMKANLFTKAIAWSRSNEQTVGAKHDYYITLSQLENLLQTTDFNPNCVY